MWPYQVHPTLCWETLTRKTLHSGFHMCVHTQRHAPPPLPEKGPWLGVWLSGRKHTSRTFPYHLHSPSRLMLCSFCDDWRLHIVTTPSGDLNTSSSSKRQPFPAAHKKLRLKLSVLHSNGKNHELHTFLCEWWEPAQLKSKELCPAAEGHQGQTVCVTEERYPEELQKWCAKKWHQNYILKQRWRELQVDGNDTQRHTGNTDIDRCI